MNLPYCTQPLIRLFEDVAGAAVVSIRPGKKLEHQGIKALSSCGVFRITIYMYPKHILIKAMVTDKRLLEHFNTLFPVVTFVSCVSEYLHCASRFA